MESIFSRHINSWRTGERAPAIFHEGKSIETFSVPLLRGWAVFQEGLFLGIEEEPLGALVTPGGSLFQGSDLFSYFDATILKGEAGEGEVKDFITKAHLFGALNICLYPLFLPLAHDLFPEAATVISFPHGAETVKMKAQAISVAKDLGAGEFDVVANLSAIADRDWKTVAREFETLRQATDGVIKIILETGLLDPERTLQATTLARDAGLDFAKTSTGKNGPGASISAVRTMSEVEGIAIKASGGIRTRAQVEQYLELGVSRIGASNLLPFLD